MSFSSLTCTGDFFSASWIDVDDHDLNSLLVSNVIHPRESVTYGRAICLLSSMVFLSALNFLPFASHFKGLWIFLALEEYIWWDNGDG